MQHNIQKISLISEKETSKVYLAGETNGSKLYIVKEIYGEDLTSLYKQIASVFSPFLPKIYDVSFRDNTTFLLEEYVEGKTLAQCLTEEEFSVARLFSVMCQLCNALTVLHENTPPIIHRDIKPENIILTPKGILKLIDLDTARIHKEETDRDTRLFGTRGYASPEQFGFAQTDARSDIYSAGILLQELTNHTSCPPSLKKKIRKIIDKATMLDPDKRYRSIGKMYRDIRRLPINRPALLFPCILLGVIAVVSLGVAFYFAGTPPVIYQYTVPQASEERTISTQSEFITPYTEQCPGNAVFVYLGHPSDLDSLPSTDEYLPTDRSTLRFLSSNTEIFTIEKNKIIGWKEGTAYLLCLDENSNKLAQWTISVTTYNDGQNARIYQTEEFQTYLLEITERTVSASNLQLAAENVNTLCDLVNFFYAIDISEETKELQSVSCANWHCCPDAVTTLQRRQSNYMDIISLAATLLQYDYEDSGVILFIGSSYAAINWYYEDGVYYCIDFLELLDAIKDNNRRNYPIFKFHTLEDLTTYVQTYRLYANDTHWVLKLSMCNQTFFPPFYMSFMQNGYNNLTGHLELGFETPIFESMEILYQDLSFDLEFINIPTDDIPKTIPTYGKRSSE